MKEPIKSLTDKRIIVQATMCGKEINLLVDTGASVGIISENLKGIKYGRRYNGTVVGAGGEMDVFYCNTSVVLNGKIIPQFLIANIDGVIDSIEKETGVTIEGILSLYQMKMYDVEIYTKDNLIKI